MKRFWKYAFGKFLNKYINTCKLVLHICILINIFNPVYFYATWLVLQASVSMTGVILELLADIEMLLMVEKDIRGGICQIIHRYAKTKKK